MFVVDVVNSINAFNSIALFQEGVAANNMLLDKWHPKDNGCRLKDSGTQGFRGRLELIIG